MDNIVNLTQQERNELFSETAYLMNTTNAIVEKDFWVVWVLSKIFAHDRLKKILKFKGGTSLSKVYNLIGRFSEDIDLILDWREVIKETPYKETKNKQDRFNKATNESSKEYIQNELLPLVKKILTPICSCSIDTINNDAINIKYPSAFDDEYLRAEILLEIGSLASWTPSDIFEISSYASDKFPQLFRNRYIKVSTILAKRTFWEKATILHQESNRDKSKKMPIRYSRHYYDLAMMTKSTVKDEALKDIKLLNEVVEFKKRFYLNNWADYDSAKVGSLKLLPAQYRYSELEKDYKNMQNMIFDKNLTFEEIIDTLKELEKEINQ